MRLSFPGLLSAAPLALLLSVSALAQGSCDPGALPRAAREVAEVQANLRSAAVPENDPKVPALIAAQLMHLKDALQSSALAAFACAPGDAEPETIQKLLGEALHAHTSPVESTIETRGQEDVGTYGADLSVQVFAFGSSPRYDEVDFRYGVECGDDNLLLVFQSGRGAKSAESGKGANSDASVGSGAPRASVSWQEVLRWDTPRYSTVADAFGDFIMMTPLSGLPGQRNWRFVVAHGEPGCGAADGPSHFHLDLLEPTSDPAQPRRVWHDTGGYLRSDVPQLSTTEDTLSFRLSPPPGREAPGRDLAMRFHVSSDNQVQPLAGSEAATKPPAAASSPNTHSPQ